MGTWKSLVGLKQRLSPKAVKGFKINVVNWHRFSQCSSLNGHNTIGKV